MSQSLFTDLFIRARERRDRQPWRTYADATQRFAEYLLTTTPPTVDPRRYVWQMEQERIHTKYILNLAGWYRVTEDKRFAQRSWEFIDDLLNWESWHFVEYNKFDLFTGETATTLALALDWLEPWLSAEQKARIAAVVEERVFAGYLNDCPPDKAPQDRAWWYRVTTNWNAVCNGGVLCLALALRGQSPLAEKVIPIAVEGLQSYIDALPDDGGCVEGIGYWQYGILYLFYACLAWEQAYGEQHPALQRRALREGLAFPFDFSPRSAPIAFCDGNRFPPYGSLLALTTRTGQTQIAAEVQQRLKERFEIRKGVEFDLFWEYHPDEIYSLIFAEEIKAAGEPLPQLRVYPSTGWSIFNLNDLSLSFRAGTTAVPHSLLDLCAINLARNGVVLLGYVENWPYPTGWFNQYGAKGDYGRHASRMLFPEDGTTTKNTLLINGIGQYTRSPSIWGHEGNRVWCDAAQAYPWFAKKVSREVQRTDTCLRLVDEFETEREAWHELRFHSRGTFRREGDLWIVENEGQRAVMKFSCDQELYFVVTEFVPSIAVRPKWNVLRVMPLNASLSSKLTTEIR